MIARKLLSNGLSRRLALTLAAFVLIASLALAGWMRSWNQRQSLDAFRELAESNAAFISETRLPNSPVLAQRLATVLGLGVGFHFAEGEPGQWPEGLGRAIESLAAKPVPSSGRAKGYEIATAPLAETDAHLVLLRPVQEIGAEFAKGILIPALGLALVCGGLGLVLARGVVQPLGVLTAWLPNLEVSPGTKPASITAPILQREDEIGQLGRALQDTTARLIEEQRLRQQSERLATLGRIATSLAHEIKNPAAAIAMHAKLLEAEVAGEPRESVDLIEEEVERITDLVNQWLFVANSQPGKTRKRDLRELVHSVSRRLRPALDHAQVRFHLEESGPAMVEVDAPRMEQVIRNLLLNAAQAMPEGGEIRAKIDTGSESDLVILTVEDEGAGFSDEALQRFGEPFFSEREGGMGIGLTLSKEVLEAHGSSIRPENNPKGGARVICRFPNPDRATKKTS